MKNGFTLLWVTSTFIHANSILQITQETAKVHTILAPNCEPVFISAPEHKTIMNTGEHEYIPK